MSGPPGSGRTELAAAAAREGARRGFEVLRTAAVRGQPGPLAWARLPADVGAPGDLASQLLADGGPLALDSVARVLGSGNQRLLVIDDIDHGGAAALQVLQMVAARAAVTSTAVVVTSVLPVGVGTELRLSGLSEEELATMLPDLAPQARHAVRLALTGLAGRPRRTTADAERARVNVTRTLRATIDRITLAAPIAGAHLASSIRTGAMCRYQPARAAGTAGAPDRANPTAKPRAYHRHLPAEVVAQPERRALRIPPCSQLPWRR